MRKTILVGAASAVLIALIALGAFYPASQPFTYRVSIELHMIVEHYDASGNLVSRTYHAMTIVNQGLDWIEDQLGDSPSTDPAKWIGVSNNETAVDPGWVVLPNEISGSGLDRAAGTYASTGTGTWNITKTFSITGTVSCCPYGLYSSLSGNSLVAAEQQGSGARKNMANGDTLKVTVQGSVA